MYYLHELLIILLFGKYIAAAVGLKSLNLVSTGEANIELHDTRHLDEWGCPIHRHKLPMTERSTRKAGVCYLLPLLSTLESCLNFPWNQPVFMPKKLSPIPYRHRNGFPLSPQLLDTETSTAQPQILQELQCL